MCVKKICYTPNPHIGAKMATQKRQYIYHTGSYFGLSKSKEIKQICKRAPLKNHVQNTQDFNPRPMSDPLYGLTQFVNWAQNIIHTHGYNPTQSLTHTNILNIHLHYHFFSHQLENCIQIDYFTRNFTYHINNSILHHHLFGNAGIR